MSYLVGMTALQLSCLLKPLGEALIRAPQREDDLGARVKPCNRSMTKQQSIG
jgi:hypothetical protein